MFKILYKEGKARVAKLSTPHGVIGTPNYIPAGTQGAVKALSPRDLSQIGAQVVLSNTYHLMLRSGSDLIKKLGGLHKFMGWSGPIFTDSGGFQVLSLGVGLEHGVGKFLKEEYLAPKPSLNKISEEGVAFQSHIDGSKHFLSPEKSIQIQLDLGSDLLVSFDDLESPRYTYEETLKSLETTERWELRSKAEHDKRCQPKTCRHVLYGVTHGGPFKDLRVSSAKFVDQHFNGVAFGGAHLNRKNLYEVVDWTVDNISEDKPRHFLGIGEVQDIFESVERGVDLFDCVAPTRRARNGSIYISPKEGGSVKNSFSLSIRQAQFRKDPKPIDRSCQCYTCQNFSRAYLRHLLMVNEILYHNLATYHNVYFIIHLLKDIREAIKKGEFKKLKSAWL